MKSNDFSKFNDSNLERNHYTIAPTNDSLIDSKIYNVNLSIEDFNMSSVSNRTISSDKVFLNVTSVKNDSLDVKISNISVKRSPVYRDTFVDRLIEDMRRKNKKLLESNGTVQKMDIGVEGMLVDDGKLFILTGNGLKNEHDVNKTDVYRESDHISEGTRDENHGARNTTREIGSLKDDTNLVKNGNSTKNYASSKAENKNQIEEGKFRSFAGATTVIPKKLAKLKSDFKVLNDVEQNEVDADYQGDMPFERLPRIEIITDEVLSELNVKQILECNLPSNATMTAWHKNGQVRLTTLQ